VAGKAFVEYSGDRRRLGLDLGDSKWRGELPPYVDDCFVRLGHGHFSLLSHHAATQQQSGRREHFRFESRQRFRFLFALTSECAEKY
jgi:hypothetical protein